MRLSPLHDLTDERRRQTTVVRIVTYGAESREAAQQWVREHADEFREAPGVKQVTFIHSKDPARVGAVMVFASADALVRYKETGPNRWLVDSLRHAWADESQQVHEKAYRVMDV